MIDAKRFEELRREALEIENGLHSDDRCQPMSMSVDIATLVAQMSDEELEQASKELALDVAHWSKKDRKKYAQLGVWQSLVVDEMWRRNHYRYTQDFYDKWKVKVEEYNGDTTRLAQENFAEMLDDIWRMVEHL